MKPAATPKKTSPGARPQRQKPMPSQDTVELVRHALIAAYRYCTTDFTGTGSYWDRAYRHSQAYDRVLDPSTWQTRSEMYFPFAMAAVDNELPGVMENLFSKDELFDLVPLDTAVEWNTARSVRDYLHYVLMSQCSGYMTCLPIVKDAIKLGCGYAIMETQYITPESWQTVAAFDNGEKVAEGRRYGEVPSQRKAVPAIRQLKFGRVLPSPTGGATPEKRDYVIVIDHMRPEELEACFADPDHPANGDIAKIKQDTLDNNIDGTMLNCAQFLKWATRDEITPNMINAALNKNQQIPYQIPVVKYFARGRHIWLANATTVIMDIGKNRIETLRCPILKASASVDSDNWFCDGIIGKGEEMFSGSNILYNTMMDVLDMVSRPRLLRNMQAIPGGMNLNPWGVTDVYGNAQGAVQTVEIPFRSETINTIQLLDSKMDGLVGTNPLTRSGQASGMVRGGAGAFESLIAQMSCRSKLTSNIIAMGFLKPLIENLLIMEAANTKNGGKKDYSKLVLEKGETYYVNASVDYNDLRSNFRVEIDMNSKMRNSIADVNLRMMIVQMINGSANLARKCPAEKLIEYLIGDRMTALKMMNGADPAAYDNLSALYALINSGGGAGPGGTPQAPAAGAPPAPTMAPPPPQGVGGATGADGGVEQMSQTQGSAPDGTPA